MNLSKRLRPDVECAPWVIEGVKELEAEIAALKAQLVGYTELAKDTIAALEVADAKIADLDSAAESLWKK